MSFLTPLYLAGALAVTLPILFHLIRRTPEGRVPFSTLMFLRPSPPRITKKRRLEHFFLLFLRALALCLLAAAFSRPFLREILNRPTEGNMSRTVVLVDTSASMRREGLWDDARRELGEVLNAARPRDEVAVLTFDEQTKSLIDFEGWSSLPHSERAAEVNRQLAETTPSWRATDLARALISAAESLSLDQSASSQEAPREKRIVLVSDLQAGSRLDALQRYAWPEEIPLEIRRIEAKSLTNAGIQPVHSSEEVSNENAKDRIVRVRVANAGNSERDNFEIGWLSPSSSGEPVGLQNVYVTRGRSRVIRLPVPEDLAPDARLILRGDDHDFDNTAYVELPPPLMRTVVYIGDDSANDPHSCRYYVERAFPDDARRKVSVVIPGQNASPLAALGDIHLMIARDKLPDDQLELVRTFVDRGGTLVYVLSSEADPTAVKDFFGYDILLGEAGYDGYTLLEGLDFRHPVLAPFAEARFADFTGVHIWKHRQVSLDLIPEHRLLARFEDGAPALVEIPRGAGRVFLFATGWHPDDSQLALSSKFVPLLNGILEYGDDRPLQSNHLAVGQVLRLPTKLASEARVFLPDQQAVELASGVEEFTQTSVPGLYTLETATPQRFAVNLAASESDTTPLQTPQLEALGVTLLHAANDLPAEISERRERQAQARELEDRQRIWKWLLFAGLIVLILETWLAGRVARRIVST